MASKTRIRVEGTQLRNWEEVDEALKRHGLLLLQREELEAEAHRRITVIKDEAAKGIAPIDTEMEQLDRAIKEYCEANRDGLEAQRKSRVLTFGTVGFRQSTRLVIKRVAETLLSLRERGLLNCIRSKEEPDKEQMAALSDEILAQVGAKRVTDDAFWFEVNRARIQGLPH